MLVVALGAGPLGAQPGDVPAHEFYFTRAIYGGGAGSEWGPRWAIDYPEADQHFLTALRRLTIVDATDGELAVALDDPKLRDYPFLYILEVGSLLLDDSTARSLREYLAAGGFMVIDDFWGTWAWENFENQMHKVFPERPIVEVPLDHPVFNAFYDIDRVIQVPNVSRAETGPTHEYDGIIPHVRGIFDDEGRLMVLINWNTDLGDAWEWADSPSYPLRYSTYAFEIAVNFVVYAMSH